MVFGRRTAAVELPGDLLTPFGVFCLLDSTQAPGSDAFLFEGALGRYSYVGVGGAPLSGRRELRPPSPRLTVRGGRREPGELPGLRRLPPDPLRAVSAALEQLPSDRDPALPPFCGGLLGYLGWAASRFSERLPSRLGPDPLFPEADLLVVRELVSFDHRQGRAWAVASGEGAQARAERLAQRVLEGLRGLGDGSGWAKALQSPARHAQAAEPRPLGGGAAAFQARVKQALEYIRSGDVFQVVLSQRFELPDSEGFSLYRTLRAASPAPYHFYLRLGGRELFGASPELLVQVEQGEVMVRPIAGTRPRGATAAEDEARERQLRADPKERAEHTMLVDLGRNDVGKVSEIGSVRVARLMELERFSHVMHLTSEVTGKLAPGLTAVDAFASAFPAGTLSGAPKLRALEIIDELEPLPRGPYGGAVGWFSGTGDAQFAIAIRTLFRAHGRLFAQAGAGIVADSDPESEWREVLAKVRASVSAAYGAAAQPVEAPRGRRRAR